MASAPRGHSQDAANDLTGPDTVSNRLREDAANKPDLFDIDDQAAFAAWKKGVKESTALDFGIDYNALGFAATDSLGDTSSAGGAFRFFGEWELFQRGRPDSGSLVFKVENRHAYTDVAPAAFGNELGYAGSPNGAFSDQEWRVTHLFWRQRFADGRGVSYLGFLDVTDYADVYPLGSSWSGFLNAAFQNGSGTIGGEPVGAFGAMIGRFLNDHLYLVGGIADANGDPTDIAGGFDTFLNDFETFKSLEFGWTTGKERLFLDNAHVTFWQIDERNQAGTPDGWGVSFSLSGGFGGDAWMPYLRGGWSDNGGSFYENSISAGFGYTRNPGQSLLGLGLNWSRPNESTFGPDLDDQVTIELFQQVQLTEGFEITPSLQFIVDPALNPKDDSIVLFGLRARVAF